MNRNHHALAAVLWALGWGLLVASRAPATDDRLTGTEPLTADRPLDEVMIEGLRRFCLRELAASRAQRTHLWQHELQSRQSFATGLESHRARLRELIGAVDPRLSADETSPQQFEVLTTLDESSLVARNELVAIHRVRWPVLAGISAEGLLLVPERVQAGVVALPDADWTPEMLCGLGPQEPAAGQFPESTQFVRQLAEAGCLVAIPLLVSRSDKYSGRADLVLTNQPHREFIYRQAFEVGRHIIGYEVQKVLAAVDLLQPQVARATTGRNDRPTPIGVIGIGEGGLVALHAAALDRRIQVCCVSGYFQQREALWQEPIYRNVWGLLTEFGDAELAGMIAPRRVIVEACRAVEVTGPPRARDNRAAVGAPGALSTCTLESVRAEFTRAAPFYELFDQRQELVLAVSGETGNGNPGTRQAISAFASGLGIADPLPSAPQPWNPASFRHQDQRTTARVAAAREKRQFDELQAHVQKLIVDSHHVRDARWRLNPAAIAAWKQKQPQLRDWVHTELIGRLPHKRLPLRPQSRQVLDADQYRGYEVVLGVYDDVIAAGILLLPKGMRAGERRPVVVCQHGLDGTPLDTISREPRPFAYYKAFSEELVKQGFIVYAPQNPYRGGDRYRVLQRMSNPLRRSLFSYIIAQHQQTLDWLATLPQVDSERIAFYGLSYGGKTAMRVPPLVEQYSLAICSGDFTDWPRTLAANNERFSYLFTAEYEVFEWNLAHVASYAELAMLMTPRPFMVEEGHRDGGQPTEWVAGEFGKVRRHYDQLGLSARAEIEFFDGPHTIHGQGTFRFLDTHLRPANQPDSKSDR